MKAKVLDFYVEADDYPILKLKLSFQDKTVYLDYSIINDTINEELVDYFSENEWVGVTDEDDLYNCLPVLPIDNVKIGLYSLRIERTDD